MDQPPARNDDHDPDFDGSMLEMVADALGFVVGIYELDEDLIYLSEQWNRLTANRPGPSYLPTQAFRALIHPDDVTRMTLALSECMRGETPFWEVDLRVRAADGAWRAMLMQARVTSRDAFGQAVRIVAVMFDLARSIGSGAGDPVLQYAKDSFEHALMGILVSTPEGAILAANPAACRITGFAVEELQSRGRDGLLDQSDPRLDIFLRRRRMLGHTSGQVRLLHKDGHGVDVDMTSAIYVDAQGLRRNVTCMRSSQEPGTGRDLERALKWLQVRKQCTRAIIRSRSSEALLTEVCKLLCEVLDLPLAWVGELDAASLTVTPRFSHGPERAFLDVAWFSADARVEEGGGPVGRALRSGRSQLVDDVLQDEEAGPWHALATRHRMHAMLALPLASSESDPMLLVLHARPCGQFSQALVEDLAELAREIAFALENLARDAALKESEQRFRTLWESALDAIVILDQRGIIHYTNPTLMRLFGYRIEEVMGRSFSMLFAADEKLSRERPLLRYLASQHGVRAGEPQAGMVCRKDGSCFPVEMSLSHATIDGESRHIVHMRDVSLRHRSEQLNLKQNAILRGIASGHKLDSTLEALARMVEEESAGWRCAFLLPTEEQGAARGVAPSLPQALLARAWAQAASAPALAAPDFSTRDLQWPLLASVVGGEAQHLAWMWVDSPRQTMPQGAPPVLQMAVDLAALALQAHHAEQRIRRLAHGDELTGLANRAAAIQSLESALARARRDESRVGLLLIDLDNFQQVNERYGQQAGDQVLRELAGHLQDTVRKGDVLARFSGDAFLVLMERVKGDSALSRVASKLQKALATPLSAAPGMELSASIGIATWPEDGDDCDALLRAAELAMMAARNQGGARHFISRASGAEAGVRAKPGPALRKQGVSH